MPRRFNLGQNTPLTCIWATGFEFGNASRDSAVTISSAYTYDNTNQHTNISGTGGNQCLSITNTTNTNHNVLSYGWDDLREVVVATALNPGVSGGGGSAGIGILFQAAGNYQFISEITNAGAVRYVRNAINSTTLTTSPPGVAVTDDWNWVVIHYRYANTGGLCNTYVADYSNLALSYNGDTARTNEAAEVDSIQVQARNVTNARVDDLIVFGRTIYYTGGSGGSGAPTEGNTLTDGTTGATCTIDRVYDDGAGNGVIFLHTLNESGGVGFVAGNTISDGSGWTATASNSIANDKASLWVDESFISVAYPTNDVSVTWSSTGVSNYTEVDDAVDTATYVSTGTVGQVDVYSLGSALPAGATPVAVHLSAYSRLNGAGSVNNLNLGYNDTVNLSSNDSIDIPISTSYDIQEFIWTNNPITGNPFTEAEVNGLEFRLTSKA